MTVIVGLTGSIGMGKSTTAEMFAARGVPVWDADAAVHKLYAAEGAGAAEIAKLAPDAVAGGAVDRNKLKRLIAQDPALLQRIEAAIHPLVARDRSEFVAKARTKSQPVVLLDIPLLFETGSDGSVDTIVVVSAPPDLQRARVLERPGMTDAQFELILAKQLPDAEKRKRADYVIDTSSLDAAERDVDTVLAELKGQGHA